MRKRKCCLIFLFFFAFSAQAQLLPEDSIAAINRTVPGPIIKKNTSPKNSKVRQAVASTTTTPIVMDFCDDDQDGLLLLNIDSINRVVLSQTVTGTTAEGILISTLTTPRIIKVNEPSGIPYITVECSGLSYMADIAVNQAGEIFTCGSNIVRKVDNVTCTQQTVFTSSLTGSINALSFDRQDNLYFGGGTSRAIRCDAGTFIPYVWHDFGTGISGGDFVMLNDKMYIAWVVAGEYRLFEATVDANNQYVSHVDLGQLPDFTWGLASEYGKLYGVTPGELFRINLTGTGFTIQTIITNTSPDQWGGAAGLHEAALDVKAFETLADAQTLQNQLPGRWTNTIPGGQTIYVAVINIITNEVIIVPVVINIHVTPANAGADQLICSSTTTVTLAGNIPASGTGLWTLESGSGIITDPADPATTVTGLLPGDNIFRWTVTAATCVGTDLVNIHVDPVITPAFAGLTPICSGNPAPLLPLISLNGVSGTWSPAVVSNTTTATYTFTPTGVPCALTTQLTQIVNPKIVPAFNALPDICSGTAAPILPATSANGINGTWNPPTVSNAVSGIYIFTPNAGECATATQLTQTVNSSVASFAPLAPICAGDIAPLLPNVSVEGVQGTWQPAVVNNMTTATYTFTPVAGSCAVNPFSLTQQVNPKPTAFAGNDGLAAIGIPYQLQASGGISYEWIAGAALLNDPFIADPKAVLTNPTTFVVKVTNDKGCSATDDVFVKLYKGITYYIPNAFSPNGDGLNDVLKAIPAGISSTTYFTIFNRWSQPVFSTADLSVGWDGTYKNAKQPSGTYVWVIKGIARNHQVIEMTGTVQLIR